MKGSQTPFPLVPPKQDPNLRRIEALFVRVCTLLGMSFQKHTQLKEALWGRGGCSIKAAPSFSGLSGKPPVCIYTKLFKAFLWEFPLGKGGNGLVQSLRTCPSTRAPCMRPSITCSCSAKDPVGTAVWPEIALNAALVPGEPKG